MTRLDPLAWNVPIVDGGGRPTSEFMRKWTAQRTINESVNVPLTNGHILVGDAGGQAADVAMSGDASITNTGVVTVSKSAGVPFGSAAFQDTSAFDAAGAAAAAQTNAEAYADAQVAPLLPKSLGAGNIFVGNGSGVAQGVAMSGDAVVASNGTITVGSTGVWTPTITGSVSNPTIAYSLNTGTWAISGPLMFIKGSIVLSAISGGSGSAQVSGLPRAAVSDSLATYFNLALQNVTAPAGTFAVSFALGPGNTFGIIRFSVSGALFTTIQCSGLSNNTDIEISGCYRWR